MFEDLSIYEWYFSIGVGSLVLFTSAIVLWCIGCTMWAFLDDKEEGWVSKKAFRIPWTKMYTKRELYSLGAITDKEYYGRDYHTNSYIKEKSTQKIPSGLSILYVYVSILLGVVIAILSTLIFLNIILPYLAVSLIIGSIPAVLFSARFCIRLSKKLELHVTNKKIHNTGETE